MQMTFLFLLFTASLVPLAQGWVPHVFSNTLTSSLNALLDTSDGSHDSFLSASDRTRLAEMRSRHVTMPIMILDVMLPKQRLEFGSPDSKFHRLIEAVLAAEHSELGMIGMNPHTGRPLNMGVTLKVAPDDVSVDRLGIRRRQRNAVLKCRVSLGWMTPTPTTRLIWNSSTIVLNQSYRKICKDKQRY